MAEEDQLSLIAQLARLPAAAVYCEKMKPRKTPGPAIILDGYDPVMSDGKGGLFWSAKRRKRRYDL
jgi:hypothetical protein